jgi:hypothetical protein
MSPENRKLMPNSSRTSHRSFIPAPQETLDFVSTQALFQEMMVAMATAEALRKDPARLDKLLTDVTPLMFDDALQRSAIESAVLMMENPRIPIQIPHVATIFRLMRTMEISGGHKRGGNALIIGSGLTIPEVLALYIKPPDPKTMLDKLAQADPTTQMLLNTVMGNSNYSLSNGHVTAIEPDPNYKAKVLRLQNDFNIPDNMLTFKNITVGEALEGDQIPDNLDLVLWHRVEPRIFLPGSDLRSRKERRQAEREAKKSKFQNPTQNIIEPLFDHLSPGVALL